MRRRGGTMTITLPATGEPVADGAVSVETVAVDGLRATIRVRGPLSTATLPLLDGVLTAHERAGRRYVRVDLRDCPLTDRSLLEPLRARHAAAAEAGGLLVFDNADEASAALLRRGD